MMHIRNTVLRYVVVNIALVGVWLLPAGPAAQADPLSLRLGDDTSHYSNGVGGEFMAYDITGIPFAPQAAAFSSTTFQTFCVEYTEEFTPGTLLYADIYTGARFGGATGAIADPLHSGETYDPLDPRTAYLFTKFSLSTLSNYDYVSGLGRSASAGELQKAIWYLEGEITTLVPDSQADKWVKEANIAVALGGEWYNKGLGNVGVLNLWTSETQHDLAHKAQDQLVLLDAPAPGPLPSAPLPATLAGGMTLLAGFGLARKRHHRTTVMSGR